MYQEKYNRHILNVLECSIVTWLIDIKQIAYSQNRTFEYINNSLPNIPLLPKIIFK